MGCLLSRLTALGESCWLWGWEEDEAEAEVVEDDDGFGFGGFAGLDEEGLFPIFANLKKRKSRIIEIPLSTAQSNGTMAFKTIFRCGRSVWITETPKWGGERRSA